MKARSKEPKFEMHFGTYGELPFVDFVTKRKAYAVSMETDCYRLGVYKDAPYSGRRQDWEPVDWVELPNWVRLRFTEIKPLLKIMKEPT